MLVTEQIPLFLPLLCRSHCGIHRTDKWKKKQNRKGGVQRQEIGDKKKENELGRQHTFFKKKTYFLPVKISVFPSPPPQGVTPQLTVLIFIELLQLF